ncbi:MAG: sigma 54-interacting transcriptional regulator [Acidobacteriota bacterium]
MHDDTFHTETQSESGRWQTPAATQVTGLTLLHHPDPARVGERIALPALDSGRAVALSRSEPRFAPPGAASSRPLGDARLSRQPWWIEPHRGGLRLRRNASRTTLAVDDVTITHDVHILDADAVARGVVLLLGGRVALLLHRLDPFVPRDLPHHGLVGESAGMLQVRQAIQQVAPLNVPVLLRGASGTGKELVARAIHDASPRRDGPYVPVNLAALPGSLAAAELFGAERGAFTGADRRRTGHFARAQGGTLFLDEIGDALGELQVLLLRALESGEIQPLGDERPRRIDARIVAATDADLEDKVRAGAFRAPLLHRLGGFVLRLPTLDERRDDFGRLFIHLLRRELTDVGAAHRLTQTQPWLPASLVAHLATRTWPGNVRQLRNAVRQLVITYRDADVIRRDGALDALLAALPGADAASSGEGDAVDATAPEGPSPRPRPAEIDDDALFDAMRAARWQPQRAADRLGIPRASIYRLIERSDRVRTAAALSQAEIDAALDDVDRQIAAAADRLQVSAAGLRRRMRRLGLSGR